ncbi:MAG: hypothetical protein ACRDJH_25185 [Thermomicrobiales bacterium]
MTLGLSGQELQSEIERLMAKLDEAQEDADQLGQYGELMRMTAAVAFQRAADLIAANNRRIDQQLRNAGIQLEAAPS